LISDGSWIEMEGNQEMDVSYDVVILGAGPAGLFAAYELIGSNLKVLVIDKGEEPLKRDSLLFGVGGAGAYSDGKLNLTPRIGGSSESFKRTDKDVQEIIDEIDKVFTKLGAREEYSGINKQDILALKKKAANYGIEFVAGKQRHIGSDHLPSLMDKLYREIELNDVTFALNTEIRKILRKGKEFVLKNSQKDITARYIIAAPGRPGAYWLRKEAEELGIKYRYGPIDVGVRLEFPAEIYQDIQRIMYDAKFRMFSPTHDDLVRTFCANPGGFVSVENYGDFILVNGHAAKKKKSQNTNLALLSRIELTDPVEDTTTYGRAIAQLANTIGGGKPLLQRLKDLKIGRRSTWERLSHSSITPTLKNATPGDISMALPKRIVTNILEAIEKINNLFPGINSENTLIYAPEIKFYDTKYEISPYMETNVKNFYVAGDASGYARGIVYSAVTGMLAAKNIKEKGNSLPK